MQVKAALAILLLPVLLLQEGIAGPLPDPESLPHVDRRGRSAFIDYRHADDHRAFAIAPGGAWGWMADQPSTEKAVNAALHACQSATRQICQPYAAGNQLVFDRDRWNRSWKTLQQDWSEAPPVGTQVGQRFPNLAFTDAAGQRFRVEDFRGRALILHFWGSWCPPCMRELPLLHRFSRELTEKLGDRAALVLLQVREPVAVAQQWLRKNDLPGLSLYDSGNTGDDNTYFQRSGAGPIADRDIAARFPTSYFLDPGGRVLLRHTGPIERWGEYLPLIDALL